MNFYKIEPLAIGSTKYPWCGGWGPLADMPFFNRLDPVSKQIKLKSFEVNPRTPGLIIDSGAKVWSDVIGCGGSPPSYFVSGRIINDLESEGIPILCTTEFPIAKNLSKALQKLVPPKYYVLEAESGINYAYDLMGIDLDVNGKPTIDSTKRFPEAILRLSTWNGADLFGKRAVYDSTIHLLCTERIKKIAEAKGWTNISFKPVKVG